MSAKKAPSRSTGAYPETIWVAADLSDEEREGLKRRSVPIEDTIKALAGLIEQGFKISISYDERSDCVGAYLTAPKAASKGRTICLSARAPTLEKALLVLLFKHFEKLHEEWEGYLGEGGQRPQWG